MFAFFKKLFAKPVEDWDRTDPTSTETWQDAFQREHPGRDWSEFWFGKGHK